MSLQQQNKIACPAVRVQQPMSAPPPLLRPRRDWVDNIPRPRPRRGDLSASAGGQGRAQGDPSASAEDQGSVHERLSASASAYEDMPASSAAAAGTRDSDDYRSAMHLGRLLTPSTTAYDWYGGRWSSISASSSVAPSMTRLRRPTVPIFPATTTISVPEHSRDLIRGTDNIYDGTSTWYLIDRHQYVCNSPADEAWFLELQSHFVHVAQIRRDTDAAIAAELSESSGAEHTTELPESSGAGHAGEGEEEEEAVLFADDDEPGAPTAPHVGSPPAQWRLDPDGQFSSRFPPEYWLSYEPPASGRVVQGPYGQHRAPDVPSRPRWSRGRRASRGAAGSHACGPGPAAPVRCGPGRPASPA